MCTTPEIRNVKFHFKVHNSVDLYTKIKGLTEICAIKWVINFAVLRDVSAIFTIFYHSNYINVTSVKKNV